MTVDKVLLTVGGSTAELDGLSAATILADLDVTGLVPARPTFP